MQRLSTPDRPIHDTALCSALQMRSSVCCHGTLASRWLGLHKYTVMYHEYGIEMVS